MPTRIPASERTSQKLDELLSQGVADGDARAELLKLAVRKIVEEALEAEVAEAVGREYYENGVMVRMGTDLDGDARVDRWDRNAAAAAKAEQDEKAANAEEGKADTDVVDE